MAKTKKKPLPAKNSRQQIIESAEEFFFTKGFEATTFSDIAKQVGIAQPSIYAHFKNKMDLLNSVCEYAIGETRAYIDRQINPKDPALDRLRSYLFANIDFFSSEKKHAHGNMAFYFFSSATEEMREIFRHSQEQAISRLESVLFQAGHEGRLITKDAPLLARTIHSILVGDCYKAIYAGSQSEVKQIKARLWSHVQVLINPTQP